MFLEHPTFELPADEGVKIWRYMDFTKLVSILDQEALYFARTDTFEDPFEGSSPRSNILARQIVPPNVPPGGEASYLTQMARMGEFMDNLRKHVFVSCWHLNESESAAMWKLYLKSGEGIAIQSTVGRLKSALQPADTLHIGMVKYIDYDKEAIAARNALTPIVHKRKSFEHERELRAVVVRWPSDGAFGAGVVDQGIAVKVDLDLLIEGIFLAPRTAPWLSVLISNVLKKYGRNTPLHQSRLDDRPLF